MILGSQRRRGKYWRDDGKYIRSLDVLVRCPPEIAWHVLGFWRCQYPVDTQFIDELGVH